MAQPASAVERRRERRVPAGRLPVSRVRSAGFALVLVLLVGAVPTLGWVGLTLIRDSKAGKLITRVSDPRAPGYEAVIDPTPTGLLVQKDAKGGLVSLTFLALGGSSGGGSVMFLPINTAVTKPAFGVDRFQTAYRLGGEQGVVSQAGTMLNVGLGDVIAVNDAKWASLTARSGPIRFDNPDTVTAGSRRFPAGPIVLRPNQVGPYLSALNRGESDLNRMNRHQIFWQGWLKAIGPSPSTDAIPGETRSGIGFFVRTLARGPVRLETLPVGAKEVPLFYVEAEKYLPLVPQIRRHVAGMVPYPTSPSPGARVTVRLLNGADGDPIPQTLVRGLVLKGAAVTAIGNDRKFGRRMTVIQYRDAAARKKAKMLQSGLGGRGVLVLNPRGSDAFDVTIVLGQDILPANRSVPGTRPTTKPGSVTTTSRSSAGG